LQKAIDIFRANEATTKQLKTLSNNVTDKEPVEVQALQKKLNCPHKQSCGKCENWHLCQQFCPAQGAECYKCGRKNHFAKVCRTHVTKKPHSNVYDIEQHSSDTSDDMFIGMIQKNSKVTDWKVTISVNKQRTVFKMDTGAQCNVVSKHKYNRLSKAPLQKSHTKLVAFRGHQLNACGKAVMSCQYKGKHYPVEFEVVDEQVPNILGLKTCTQMKLVRVDTIIDHDVDLLDKYSDVFEGLGCITDVVYHIKIDPSCQTVVHPLEECQLLPCDQKSKRSSPAWRS